MTTGKHLLIAEDDLDDRLLFEAAYTEQGFSERLLFFENGLELMNYLQANTSAEQEHCLPDLILLDLNMPKKNGREVLHDLKLNKLFEGIPVVVMSTASSDKDREDCLNYGALKFITKPHSFEKLKETVSEIHQLLVLH